MLETVLELETIADQSDINKSNLNEHVFIKDLIILCVIIMVLENSV